MTTQDNLKLRQDVMLLSAGYGGKWGLNDDPQQFAGMPPYKKVNTLTRNLREIWFRANLPFKEIWYNKEIEQFEGKHLIIYDPLITPAYLRWLQKHNQWHIHFFYGNKVGRARHMKPDRIPEGIDAWTYDDKDSRDYGLHYCTKNGGNPRSFYPKEEPQYDVMFVGKDKGRGEFIFRLEKELNDAGLRTFFRVMPETRFDKNKDPRYSEPMPYDGICKVIARSRAILNVALPGQEGHTIRDTEAIWNNVKLITTNPKTAQRDYYNPANILVVEEATVTAQQIVDFLSIPFENYSEETQQSCTMTAWVKEITGN